MQIPKLPPLTSPLTKSIRTLEGILITLIASGTAILSLVDPSSLPHKEAGWLLTAQGGALLLQRGLLKIVAIQKGIGVGPPIDDQQLDKTMAAITDQAAAVADMVNTHGEVLTKLNQVDLTHLPTKADLDELVAKLQAYAQAHETPPAPVDVAGNLAAGEIPPEAEAAIQPPDPADPVPGAPPAAPSAAATIPPPVPPAGAGG